MKRKDYSVSEITEKELIELKKHLGASASEIVRLAVRELYRREIKGE